MCTVCGLLSNDGHQVSFNGNKCYCPEMSWNEDTVVTVVYFVPSGLSLTTCINRNNKQANWPSVDILKADVLTFNYNDNY